MKTSWKRLQEKYGSRHVPPSMLFYEQTLRSVVNATGNGRTDKEEQNRFNVRLKQNQVYGVRCNDNPDYWKSVMLKRNDLSGKFQVFITNPVYGDPPPGMEEVSSEQVFKQMREMNAGLVVDADLKAFPFPGRSGQ